MTKIENYEELKELICKLSKDFNINDDAYLLELEISSFLDNYTSSYQPKEHHVISWDDETDTGKEINIYDIEIDSFHSRSGHNEHIEISDISTFINGVEETHYYKY